MNLLIVDDERLLVKGLALSLKKEGFTVYSAYDGEEALSKLKTEKIDMVLLDIMLPGMDGMTLLRKIRDESRVPVIMLTARDDYADMVMGLELGADDYVTKPFQARVLVARIRSLARRSCNAGTPPDSPGGLNVIRAGRLVIDPERRTVHKDGREIDLTAKEFDILKVLASNNGIVLSRERIFDLVWQEPDIDTRTVDVHISKIREKIEDEPSQPSYIRTKWGVGYFFRRDAAE